MGKPDSVYLSYFIQSETSKNQVSYTGYVNTSSVHGMGIMMNTINSGINMLYNNKRIYTFNSQLHIFYIITKTFLILSSNSETKKIYSSLDMKFFVYQIIAISFSFIPLFFIPDVVKERSVNKKIEIRLVSKIFYI